MEEQETEGALLSKKSVSFTLLRLEPLSKPRTQCPKMCLGSSGKDLALPGQVYYMVMILLVLPSETYGYLLEDCTLCKRKYKDISGTFGHRIWH